MIENPKDIAKMIDVKLDVFFDAIEKYATRKKFSERYNEVVKEGLEVFLDIPYAISSSLFLLNEESFEFEHKVTIDEMMEISIKKVFPKFIELGHVGKVLESGSILSFDYQEDTIGSESFILSPLIASWGIIGIAVISLRRSANVFEQPAFKLCSLHSGLFSSSLENTKLFYNLKRSKLILEQKVAARTMDLAQSKRELKTIFDSVHTGILVVNSESNIIIRVNPVAERMINDSEINILNTNANLFLEDINTSRSTVFSAFTNFESELVTSDNQIKPIIRTISNIRIDNVRYRVESFIDITDRKKYENELKNSNEILELKVQERTIDLQLLIHKLKDEINIREKAELEAKKMLAREKELNELKTRFVSMISHEFRTPLTVIKSAAQMMERFIMKFTEDERKAYSLRIVNTVDIMTDLIENVIFIGKSDSKKIRLSLTEIFLPDYCKHLIEDLRPTLPNKRELILVIKGEQTKIFSDEKLLRHIIINLLTNAVKYSEPETPVILELNCQGAHTIFTVTDHGIGIPDKDQEHIFELFYRANNVGNRSGTGLGMAVVVQSLKALDGKITLKSQEGIGSSFTFTIPNLQSGQE